MVGNYEEGRTHTKGLLKMAQVRGGVNEETFASLPRVMNAILMSAIFRRPSRHAMLTRSSSDVKAACATLSRPIFPIPWPIEPLSPPLLARVLPAASNPLYHLAIAFSELPLLSPRLVSLLLDLRNLVYFSDWNAYDPSGLNASEYEVFRRKSHETEHQLLSYPYDAADLNPPKRQSELFHPLELLTRIGALLHVCNIITISSPSSGLLRGLVSRCKRSVQRLQLQTIQSPLPPPALDLLAWVLFLAAQSSFGEKDRPWFVRRLADLVGMKHWREWADVEAVMLRFLYVKRVQSLPWRVIWDEVVMVTGDERGGRDG